MLGMDLGLEVESSGAVGDVAPHLVDQILFCSVLDRVLGPHVVAFRDGYGDPIFVVLLDFVHQIEHRVATVPRCAGLVLVEPGVNAVLDVIEGRQVLVRVLLRAVLACLGLVVAVDLAEQRIAEVLVDAAARLGVTNESLAAQLPLDRRRPRPGWLQSPGLVRTNQGRDHDRSALVRPGRGMAARVLRPGAHHIRLPLHPFVVIGRNPVLQRHRRMNAALGLLHDMPGLVRQVTLLPRRDVDLAALGVGERAELGRLR